MKSFFYKNYVIRQFSINGHWQVGIFKNNRRIAIYYVSLSTADDMAFYGLKHGKDLLINYAMSDIDKGLFS